MNFNGSHLQLALLACKHEHYNCYNSSIWSSYCLENKYTTLVYAVIG